MPSMKLLSKFRLRHQIWALQSHRYPYLASDYEDVIILDTHHYNNHMQQREKYLPKGS